MPLERTGFRQTSLSPFPNSRLSRSFLSKRARKMVTKMAHGPHDHSQGPAPEAVKRCVRFQPTITANFRSMTAGRPDTRSLQPFGVQTMPASSSQPPPVTPDELSPLPLFVGVPTHELRALISMCRSVTFAPRETIFREGTNADRGLLLLSGTVRVHTTADDREYLLNSVAAGQLLGESGLLAQAEVRSASVVAATPIRALELTRRNLSDLRGSHVLAAIQISMLNASARRLRQTQRTMTSILVRAKPTAATRAPTAHPSPKTSAWSAFLNALGNLA